MESIAHYNLIERIGKGGLGETYRARDTRVGRTVALKIVDADIAPDADSRARLLSEATIAATLSHPNVSALFDTGEADGRVYLAYEYAPGHPLHEEIAGGAMNLRRALELGIQLSDGVAHAHAHGIIHGDLRPGTIIITPKGSAKILDFGFARWTRGGMLRVQAAQTPDALPPDATRVLAYLSPEQALGGTIDSRTDVFSLGVLIYEALTGRSPFGASTAAATVVNVIQEPVVPPSEINNTIHPDLDHIVMQTLVRDLSQRQQSAAVLASELRRVLDRLEPRPVDPRRDSSSILPLDERPDKSPAAVLFLGVIVAAVVAAAVVWWWVSQ
jgi:eukaryotic-like serine/threonine-protein kinase